MIIFLFLGSKKTLTMLQKKHIKYLINKNPVVIEKRAQIKKIHDSINENDNNIIEDV